ncbi:MAG: glycosyltransferase family 9 protein [Xanthobacteraceae bacterium]|nr:glycosyltransferase family 9 protein [Xanthobacteraceae bacterium]
MISRPDGIRRVLLIRTDKIGDAIVSTPVFAALRQRFPDAEIDLLLGRKNGAAAPLLGGLTRIVHTDKKLRTIISILTQCRKRRYDVAIDMLTGDSMTAAIYTALSGARIKIGFDDTSMPIYSVPVRRAPKPEHQVLSLLRLLKPLGIDVAPKQARQSIVLPKPVVENARSKIIGVSGDARAIIMINISGSSARKYWGTANYTRLAHDLKSDAYRVILVSAPSDAVTLREIAAASGAEWLEPSQDLADFSAFLSFANLIVTPDTSIVHIAASLGKPVVTLTGSSLVSAEWYAWGVPNRAICCDGGVPDIPYGDVELAVRSLLFEMSADGGDNNSVVQLSPQGVS